MIRIKLPSPDGRILGAQRKAERGDPHMTPRTFVRGKTSNAMNFFIYQCTEDSEYFVVTDAAKKDKLDPRECPCCRSELKPIGRFEEMGERRVAFDEAQAKAVIRKQVYYKFHAEHLAGVPIAPEMPG